MVDNYYFNSKTLRRLRRVIGKVFKLTEPDLKLGQLDYAEFGYETNLRGEYFQQYLYDKINGKEPFLLTRFGCGVLLGAIDYVNRPSISNIYKYLTHKTDCVGINKYTGEALYVGDGFYPIDKASIYKFGSLIYSILPQIDILASIMKQETYFDNIYKKDLKRCAFEDMEPWRWKSPWTSALKGKKVLVIHPFVTSIRYQYDKYWNKISHIGSGGGYLFGNEDVMPYFELELIRAVQSKNISNNPYDQYESWFDALEFLKGEIDKKKDFDIAILGCGAYGMPLGAYIKMKGKQAIHMGGALQYLFGIKSKRGDEIEDIRKLYNEHWIRPLPEDIPQNYMKMENGCYW